MTMHRARRDGETTATENETPPEPPPPVPVKEKIVGDWNGSLQLTNESQNAVRDKIEDEAVVDEFDNMVADMIFSSFKMSFKDDGSVTATQPGGDKEASGTYVVEDDQNTTATVKLTLQTQAGDEEISLDVTFEDDDTFSAPWNYGVPDLVKDVFHIEVLRKK